MRTALCLYGQPRDVHKSSDIIRNVVIPNNCDVFLHAWYDHRDLSMRKMTPGHENRRVMPNVDEYLVATYRTLVYSFEYPKTFFDKEFIATEENVDACWPWSKCYDRQTFIKDRVKCINSMWYSIMQSVMMKDLHAHDEGFTYDCVLLSRYDVSPTSSVDVSKYDLTKLYTRNHPYPRGEVSDWFMFSNDSNMNVVASTYFSIDRLYRQIQDSSCKIWTNEAFLRDQLQLHGIKHEVGDFDVSF
jgi:hypothetical protein